MGQRGELSRDYISDYLRPLRPVAQTSWLLIQCADCGSTVKFEPRLEQTANEQLDVGEFETRLVCSHCRGKGSIGKNVSLWAVWGTAR
ncbi:hypothetical protein SAMN05216548_10731 [Faunimonas pinastri]|uniref:Uncharacterized protein n=1 Tax=Faunimonas pinastri TaxID=1855383 RepID=A0A1H9I9X0_9HYPH|nr:hypothetical protein SAMN05216548_10731 [Faunimonas pinastri]